MWLKGEGFFMSQANQKIVIQAIEKHKKEIMALPDVSKIDFLGKVNDSILCVYIDNPRPEFTIETIEGIIQRKCPVEFEYTGDLNDLSKDTSR